MKVRQKSKFTTIFNMKAYILFQSLGISSRLSVSCLKENKFFPPFERPKSPYMNDAARRSLSSIMEKSEKDISERYENLALTINKVSVIVYVIWILFISCLLLCFVEGRFNSADRKV